MPDLSLDLGRRRAPSHRPWKSVDQTQRINQVARQDDAHSIRRPYKSSESLSWLTSMWKPSKTPLMVRSGDELHRIMTPVPPVPAGLSSSPSSARSSYESRVYNIPGNTLTDDVVSDAVSLRESRAPRSRSPLSRRLTRSASDFYECFADTDGGEVSSRPTSVFSHSHLVAMHDQHQHDPPAAAQQEEEWSANVRQLIEETELAFEAVGNALNELQLASWHVECPGPAAPAPNVPRHPRATPPSPVIPSHENQKSRTSLRATPSRRMSVSKSRRQSQKRKHKREFFKPSKLPAKSHRWPFSDSLSLALLSQRFKRVVADEMLTPARMEELKRRREKAQADARLLLECPPSNESLHTIGTDNSETSVEPFHLESLLSRLGASAEKSLPAFPEDKDIPLTTPSDQGVAHSDLSPPNSVSKDNNDKEAENGKGLVKISSSGLPSPPSKSTCRVVTKASIDLLPTIPETSATTSDSMRPRRSQDDKRDSVDNDEFVYLNGTALSSANPSFRHGPITYQKPEADRDDADDVDETVDWKAFQMAILGGAGDLVSGMYEDDVNEMAEEMADWFETFGFETHGQLISSTVATPSPRNSQDSADTIESRSPSSVKSDHDLPIPVLSEEKDHASGLRGIYGPFDTIKFFRSSSLRRWEIDPEVKRYSLRETILSPPKPLVVGGDAPEDVSESVADMAPMGCNMEHDLEQYLRWETDHVYGGAF